MASDVDYMEEENILTNLFANEFQENYHNSSEFSIYLSELCSYGISKLNSELLRLTEEKSQVLKETQSLAFHNYKTFIQTAECCKEIFQDFQIIGKNVDSVLNKIPNLTQSCSNFLKQAQEINISRKINNQTLVKHSQLLEILELPQLMDTCVRNEYYEETLELAEYVKRIEKKHSNIPIVAKIVEEVKHSMQLMLNQLIQQLKSGIQLPACLRVIGYLRRIGVFTEAELRIKFLQARDCWFQSVLNAIPTDDAYHHISKTIEASRVHLFDVIAQYRAIFSDDDTYGSKNKEDNINESALFYGWIFQKISQFLHTLEKDLERGVSGRLDSLLGQCMYFGLSFSRVGADFRGLVEPIFRKTIFNSFSNSVLSAENKLDEMLQSYTLLGTQSNVPSSAFGISASQPGNNPQPPMVLLEFQPLAVYCNGLIIAFNEIRLCLPISLVVEVTLIIERSLIKAVECILTYHRLDETTLNAQELEKFGMFCKAFGEELVPFLNRCLCTLFPPSQLSQIFGKSSSDIAKKEKLGELDIESIISPLKSFIPALPELPKMPDLLNLLETQINIFETQKTLIKLDDSPMTNIISSNEIKMNLVNNDNENPFQNSSHSSDGQDFKVETIIKISDELYINSKNHLIKSDIVNLDIEKSENISIKKENIKNEFTTDSIPDWSNINDNHGNTSSFNKNLDDVYNEFNKIDEKIDIKDSLLNNNTSNDNIIQKYYNENNIQSSIVINSEQNNDLSSMDGNLESTKKEQEQIENSIKLSKHDQLLKQKDNHNNSQHLRLTRLSENEQES